MEWIANKQLFRRVHQMCIRKYLIAMNRKNP